MDSASSAEMFAPLAPGRVEELAFAVGEQVEGHESHRSRRYERATRGLAVDALREHLEGARAPARAHRDDLTVR